MEIKISEERLMMEFQPLEVNNEDYSKFYDEIKRNILKSLGIPKYLILGDYMVYFPGYRKNYYLTYQP